MLAHLPVDTSWTFDPLQVVPTVRPDTFCMGGTSRPLGLGSHPERSQPERTGREDRHSNFYEISDNLSLSAGPHNVQR